METEPTTGSAELQALRARLDALERESVERKALDNAALAAAQDRSYWLDRWHVDLNRIMRGRGAGELRAAVRAARSLYRLGRDARERIRDLPLETDAARRKVEEEQELAAAGGSDERFARTLSPDPLRVAPVTDLLYARLTEDDVRAVEARLEPAEAALWETATPEDRRRLALAFAAHYRVQPALECTGLSAAMPPPGVHAMAHGAAAAGGSAYYADLVADALGQTGFELAPGRALLDFGCSSGRVVRVLAAAHPELEWHGCDPIPDAIEWARANLPGIDFTLSPEYPPLPHPDRSLDAAFAISIWSHFSERAALDWLLELRRVLRPGGRLVLTTHGEHTLLHTHRAGVRSVEQLETVQAALRREGFWYAPEFGEQGDHGVANPDWGTAFLTPEWLLTRLTPDWRVLLYRPGRVEDNQDLYVLEPR